MRLKSVWDVPKGEDTLHSVCEMYTRSFAAYPVADSINLHMSGAVVFSSNCRVQFASFTRSEPATVECTKSVKSESGNTFFPTKLDLSVNDWLYVVSNTI